MGCLPFLSPCTWLRGMAFHHTASHEDLPAGRSTSARHLLPGSELPREVSTKIQAVHLSGTACWSKPSLGVLSEAYQQHTPCCLSELLQRSSRISEGVYKSEEQGWTRDPRGPFQPQCVYTPLKEFLLNLPSSCLPTPDFTVEYIQRGGLRDPLIFRSSDGLGIK